MLLAAACGSPTIDGPIDYHSTGGITGDGDGTSVHVELDGRLTKTSPAGTDQRTLDAAALASLHDAVYRAQPIDRTIHGNVSDGLADVVAVQLDGDVEQLVVDRDAERIPADVAALIALMRSL